MDPRGPAAGPRLSAGPLAALAAAGGTEFPHLAAARARTEEALRERRAALGAAAPAEDGSTAVVLMGSWGRRELTSGSDDDFVVLGDGWPAPAEVREVLTRPPGQEGVFGGRVREADLVDRIGLGHDTNENLTRRMLFLLESVALTGEAAHAAARAAIVRSYLDAGVRDQRVPRFLLNDLIRYWRTICVDFEAKARERGEDGWGLRNAKLRTSRKLLFAGGLLPVLECHELRRAEMHATLTAAFAAPPSDRVAAAFLRYDAVDAGVRALQAYDAFLALVDDEAAREHLRSLTRDAALTDPLFRRARGYGDQLESGLLALLFERQPLARLVREYGVF
ncbi:MAG TPA: hypothetical protein VF533_13845 [Solirubrobacteraceae bacterium]